MGPNYSILCKSIITVYKKDFTKAEYRAFMDFKKVQSIDKTGSTEVNSAVIVIPKKLNGLTEAPVAVGDKVLMGSGPEISSREDWAALIPSTTPGLVVIRNVDPKYYQGALLHWEAGG